MDVYKKKPEVPKKTLLTFKSNKYLEIKNSQDRLDKLFKDKIYNWEGFSLSTNIINLNPSDYIAWVYRRHYCEREKHNDYEFTLNVIQDNPKCYQAWNHLRWICLFTKQLRNTDILTYLCHELKRTEAIISSDSRNFNVWGYHHYIFDQIFHTFEKISYTEKTKNELTDLLNRTGSFGYNLLRTNIYNNMVWAFRYSWIQKKIAFLGNKTSANKQVIEGFIIKQINDAVELCKQDLYNESAWNFLMGFLEDWAADESSNVLYFSESRNMKIMKFSWNNPLVSEVLTLFETNGENSRLNRFQLCAKAAYKIHCQDFIEAKRIYKELQVLDQIRATYWKFKEIFLSHQVDMNA